MPISDLDPSVLAAVVRNANSPEHLRAIGALAGPLEPSAHMGVVGQPGYGKSYAQPVVFPMTK